MLSDFFPSLDLQERSVLIVGMGALGCAAARLLAPSRLGRLTLIDPDSVEISNLQRQVLFRDADVGKAKAPAAVDALERNCKRGIPGIEAITGRFDAGNAHELAKRHDFVIDGSDDPETKYLINTATVATDTPYCYAGVMGTSGQLMSVRPGRSACLACVFPPDPATTAGAEGGCAAHGIVAPVAGLIGSLQAREALLCLTRAEEFRPGRMVLYEMRLGRWRTVVFSKNPNCGCCASPHAAYAPRRQSICLL